MRSLFTYFFILFVPSLVLGQGIHAESIDSLLNKLEKHDKWMGVIAVTHKGDLVYEKAIGNRKMTKKEVIKADPRTRYRIGSITKMYTATMIVQLIEEGKLDWSTSLSEFYPEMPQADSITIDLMLLHRTGLHNFTNDSAYWNYMEEERSQAEMLEMFRNTEPDTIPGSMTAYSNTNYVLLGYIIEDLANMDYGEALQERIFKPAGLRETAMDDGLGPEQNEALSYRKGGKDWEEATETNMDIPQGAGAISATAADLARFADALFGGKLVETSSLEKMKETKGRYGRGMFLMPFYEKSGYGHTGGIDGFSSVLAHFHEDSLSVSLVSNGSDFSNNEVLKGVLSNFYDKPFELPDFSSYDLSADLLEHYPGEYHSDSLGLTFTIRSKEDHITGQVTGQPEFSFTAASKTEFRFDKVGAVIRFREKEDGKYQKLILEQGGGRFGFYRE